MTTGAFSCRRRAERFAQLLNEADGGRRHHIRSDVDGELTDLVALGIRLRTAPPPAEADPEFRVGLRAMLVAAAERDGIDTKPAADAHPAPSRSARRSFLTGPNARQARARVAVLAGVAAGAVVLSGISAASENAVPGDPLYGVKRSTERAQLALATSDLSRGQLFLNFARTRLAEAVVLRSDPLGFAAVLDDMDADTRHGVKLLTTSAVQRDEPAALDAIASFVLGQASQVTRLLDGADRMDRDRIAGSLSLLDQTRQRSDGLRAGLTCGVEQSIRTDSLGPLPRPCPEVKPSSGGSQASTPESDQQEPKAPANPPRREQTGPAQPPAGTHIATDPGTQSPPDQPVG